MIDLPGCPQHIKHRDFRILKCIKVQFVVIYTSEFDLDLHHRMPFLGKRGKNDMLACIAWDLFDLCEDLYELKIPPVTLILTYSHTHPHLSIF